jgi:murein DD-endopeptidase MepM/ murein hydrolase activator NlpD
MLSEGGEKARRRITAAVFLVVVIAISWSLAHAVWKQPQQKRNLRIYETVMVPTADHRHDQFPAAYFAALDPGLAQALYYNRPGDDSLAMIVPGIPPIGAYLPRTGSRQFQFPTSTPVPTVIPSPTTTLVPSATFTSTPEISATSRSLDPSGTPGPTAVAFLSGETGCAPADFPVAGVVTQLFHQWHSGIDLGVYTGTPVLATHSGTVTFAGWSEIGYGYLVILQSGAFTTYYAHLSAFNVATGDLVGRGSVLAWSGSTGNSSGPHVHYEVRINDVPVDPYTFSQRGYETC